ncbi:hypothetical protein BH23ACT9_BH23ACT9_25870 [soil metagenome]
MTTDSLPVLLRIREELVAAAARHQVPADATVTGDTRPTVPVPLSNPVPSRPVTQRTGRGRPAWLAAAAVVGLIALGVLIVPSLLPGGQAAPAAYAVQETADGRIHVRVDADFDQSERLRRELADRGVDVVVVDIASHPSLVGTVEFPSHQLPPDGTEIGEGEFWIDPAEFTGQVEMLVYRAVQPDERWSQSPSVFNPDEPLGGLPCLSEGPMEATVLQAAADELGLTVEWQTLSGNPVTLDLGDTVSLQPEDRQPDGQVWEAHRVAPDVIQATVLPAAMAQQEGDLPPPSMGLNTHVEQVEGSAPVCTAELAARW